MQNEERHVLLTLTSESGKYFFAWVTCPDQSDLCQDNLVGIHSRRSAADC